MHGQRRLPPGAEGEEWFQAKLKERNVKVRKRVCLYKCWESQ
jgi:hypothetical protein